MENEKCIHRNGRSLHGGRCEKQLLFPLVLLVLFAATFRFVTLQEPLNSDDAQYLQAAASFAKGEHPLQTQVLPSDQARGNHHALRLGLVLPVSFLIWVFGCNFISYYTFPFAICVLAPALTFLILRRLIGLNMAFMASVAQIVNPLEITHSTNLMSDMPVAVVSVAYFAVVILSLHIPKNTLNLCAQSAALGFLLTWVYLLRENAPVFMAPFILVSLIKKECRTAVSLSLLILFAAVAAEQAIYLWRGAEFGYRFHVTSNAVDRYVPFLRTYDSFYDYLMRYPRAVRSIAGKGVEVLFYISLVAHAYILYAYPNAFMKAISACGLLNVVTFWFCVFAPLSEGFVAQPPSMRYIQLYLCTAVICVALAVQHVREMPLWLQLLKNPLTRLRILSWAPACVIFLGFAAPMAQSALSLPRQLWCKTGTYYPILLELHVHGSTTGQDRLEVRGTHGSLRGIRIFDWIPPNKRVHWQVMDVPELKQEAHEKPGRLFLSDLTREKVWLRYIKDEQAKHVRTKRYVSLERFVSDDLRTLVSTDRLTLGASCETRNVIADRKHEISQRPAFQQ